MRTMEILAIEDDPSDLLWLKRTLDQSAQPYHLTVASTGDQAVDSLLRRGDYSGATAPDLIFLDMHLPGFGGLEILEKVPACAEMPICVLTGSKAEENAVKAYFGRSIDYLMKPLSLANLLRCFRSCQLPLQTGA